MVGQRHSPTTDASYLRKYHLFQIRKPLIERRRRERMNTCLTQLKSLLAATIQQHTSPNDKLDKADILELTVRHITLLQQQQASVTMAIQAASYSSGYKDCAKETIGYIRSTRMMKETSVCNLSKNLHNSFIARTGSAPVDQMNAYQAPESQLISSPDLYSSEGHADMASYTSSSYHGCYGNGFCDNTNTSVSDGVTTNVCEEKSVYKTNDCSLDVAPLIHDDDTVWRPW